MWRRMYRADTVTDAKERGKTAISAYIDLRLSWGKNYLPTGGEGARYTVSVVQGKGDVPQETSSFQLGGGQLSP